MEPQVMVALAQLVIPVGLGGLVLTVIWLMLTALDRLMHHLRQHL